MATRQPLVEIYPALDSIPMQGEPISTFATFRSPQNGREREGERGRERERKRERAIPSEDFALTKM